MRTAETERALYRWISLQEAGRRLGPEGEPASDAFVRDLGRDGEIVVKDFRRPGARKGRYLVDPESLDQFIERRSLVEV